MQERIVRKIPFRYRARIYVYGIRLRAASQRLDGFFAEQSYRLPLWFVAAWVMGSAGYFALLVEPAWTTMGALFVVGSCVWGGLSYSVRALRSMWTFCGVIGLGISIGMVLASLHVHVQQQTHTVALQEKTAIVNFQAQVAKVDTHKGGWRFLLQDVVITHGNDEPLSLPSYVRLSMRGEMDSDIYRQGQKVIGRGRFYPPSPPVYPGGFDFSRRAWFHRISAFGYSLGAVNVVASRDEQDSYAFAPVTLRRTIERNINEHLSGEEGLVATALLVGQRGRLSERVWRVMRTTGLAHLLALSGLHMGLVAGFMFFLFWRLLALSRFALDYNIRKVAAAAAFAASLFYLLLTGSSLPTVRAFVMVAFVLTAIMLDRKPFSLFVVAWAAAGIVLVDPYAVVDVSFQMSFAAVVALAAFYENVYQNRPLDEPPDKSKNKKPLWQKRTKRIGLYMSGVAMTTIVASMATLPFISYHFHNLAPYGLLANMFAVPLTALWIMPSGIMALLALPVGLEGVALDVMAVGIRLLLDWASFIAALPSAHMTSAAYPTSALVCFVLAGLWLCLWQRGRVVVAGVLCVIAVVLTLRAPEPDIFVSREGVVAVRDDGDNAHWLFSSVGDRWSSQQWLEAVGGTKQSEWNQASTTSGLVCDATACLYHRQKLKAAFVFEPSAFADDCAYADLVVVMGTWVVPTTCEAQVITSAALKARGAASVAFVEDELVIHYVADFVGTRVWSSF